MFDRCVLILILAIPVAVGAQTPESEAPASPRTELSTADTKAPALGSLVRVELTSGETLRGTLVSSDQKSVVLKLPTAGQIVLERSTVVAIVAAERTTVAEDGTLYRRDPNRTRYLYGPSALSLDAGEGYISQKELLFTSVAYGVTDNITILGGTIIPVLFAGEFFGIFGTKFSYEVAEDTFHIAGGAEAFFAGSTSLGAVGFIFTSATLGHADRHLTLTLGKPFQFAADGQSLGPVIVTVSGAYRLSAQFAVITENWFIPPDESAPFIRFNGLAGRFILGSWALDLGGIFVNDLPFPMPWLDLTWNW